MRSRVSASGQKQTNAVSLCPSLYGPIEFGDKPCQACCSPRTGFAQTLKSRLACFKGAKCGYWWPSTHEMPNDTIQWHGFAICVTDNQFWATREEKRLFSNQARSGNRQCERLQISISITLTLTLGIFPTRDSGIRSCADV